MYPVSEVFLQAVQENTRRYYWKGKITTKSSVVYEFGSENIVKGSGYIAVSAAGAVRLNWEQRIPRRWVSRCCQRWTDTLWKMLCWNCHTI